jgi:uncharacterized protein YecE (DUF72 family)
VRVLIGTSGYSYADWVGPVYPPGTRLSDYLPLYAQRFSLTELNFSYYRQPTRQSLLQIAAKVPEGFRFTIKAHRSLTHDRRPDWKDEARTFIDAISVLAEPSEGHTDAMLAGVLLQFPFSFHYTTENRRYLASLADALDGLRLFVEFRNGEWDQNTVWHEMERRRLGLVIPDLPGLQGLPATSPRLTAPWGYVRFHGRNEANWWNGTNVSRYDYLYSEKELRSWVEPVERMAADAEAVIVTFNNHFGGQAVQNAEQFAAMLGIGTRRSGPEQTGGA